MDAGDVLYAAGAVSTLGQVLLLLSDWWILLGLFIYLLSVMWREHKVHFYHSMCWYIFKNIPAGKQSRHLHNNTFQWKLCTVQPLEIM